MEVDKLGKEPGEDPGDPEEPPQREKPTGKPPAFAKVRIVGLYPRSTNGSLTRSDLATSISWFRRHEGGVYTNGLVCYGFMLDEDTAFPGYVDGEVIISRMGGGVEKDENGKARRIKSQTEDSPVVKSFMASMRNKVAVGVVLGSCNSSIQTEVKHRYNILNFFQVTAVWPTQENVGMIGYMVRLEKLDLEKQSWWGKAGSSLPLPREQRLPKPVIHRCRNCKETSPQVYRLGI
ncbi:uncharacterized protein BDV14DRAFT_146366 [Aspergillus stella-maris]|uniref:uncharacterized protein n=1 Tax=Aspergillus stella-maris TaxID=1810926 RepID=UPI003CCE3DD1